MPKSEQPKGRNKRVQNEVPQEERMIDLIDDDELRERAKKASADSMYTGDRFGLIDLEDDFALTAATEEPETPPAPQATPEVVGRKDGMDAFRRTPEPSAVISEQQPRQAMIVAEFTAEVNRDDPRWKGPIEKKGYAYVNHTLTPEKFPLQSTEMTVERFVDLNFSNWPHSPTTQEILTEAARLGYSVLDRAASESSLNVRPTGPNARPVVCICTDEWTGRGERVVGYVVGDASGRSLCVYGLDIGWHPGYYVFRFAARK